ncbi:acyl carrier protein, partial [Thermoflavimicrobium dichotomicum]
ERYWVPTMEPKSPGQYQKSAPAIGETAQSSQPDKPEVSYVSTPLIVKGIKVPQAGQPVKYPQIAEKPRGIALQPLVDRPIPSDKQEESIPPKVAGSSVTISLSTPESESEWKSAPLIQEDSLQEELQAMLAAILNMNPSDIDPDDTFIDMGLDSITGVEWIQAINKKYGTSITATKVYDYSNVRKFTQFLRGELGNVDQSRAVSQKTSSVETLPSVELPDGSEGIFLSQAEAQSQAHSLRPVISLENLQMELMRGLADTLGMNPSDIDADSKFIDLGLDSITGVEWIQAINREYGTSIPATKVYDYPSIREFAHFLQKELDKEKEPFTLSLDEILQQVQSGKLDVEKADQLLLQLNNRRKQ